MTSPTCPEVALEHAQTLSRFLTRCLISRPWLEERLKTHAPQVLDREAMLAFLDTQSPCAQNIGELLRNLRLWVICHLILRDTAQWASLQEVTETMTVLAELSIEYAHNFLRPALVERFGEPVNAQGQVQELLILGMGKLGGRELNVSSDIDLIFIYPEEGQTNGKKSLSNFEFFERLGKQLIQTLSELTAFGFVFRVDMRLRPNGDSGPLVCSFAMLEHYFMAQGREWERYAWIKARVLMGSRGHELERIARPFIFRKYLDFGALNAMRDLHSQIRREVLRKDRIDNIKLGIGGIREIEFIAQVFQLIRGGRDPNLQIRPTCEVLTYLGEKGILSPTAVSPLIEAYTLFRRLEHRIQYIEDAQTHDIPANEQDREHIAHTLGYSHWADLSIQLQKDRQFVSEQFNAVFADPCETEHTLSTLWAEVHQPEVITPLLANLGYQAPTQVAQQLSAQKNSSRYQQLSALGRQRIDALIPRILETAATHTNPDTTLQRSLALLDTISRRGTYLALLQQYPNALRRVIDMISASSWAAQFLTQHPLLLDELLDARSLEGRFDTHEFSKTLHRALNLAAPDIERQMDLARELHHSQVFRLLMSDLAGHLSVEQLGDDLSALADVMLNVIMTTVWQYIEPKHRPDPAIGIIAYGKLGGKELGYASDLDLVYLSQDADEKAPQRYVRWAQRMSTWLSTSTSAGQIFELDLRLRPNGEAGLIVTDLEGFRQYQLEKAWTWEHQALTRARFVAGDPNIGKAFEAIRIEVLQKPRDLAQLREDILSMRAKMRQAHANKSHDFNVKHDAGGLIDVEFVVQYLVLGHSQKHLELTKNLGNIALLNIAAQLGLLPTHIAQNAANAYRTLRAKQHRLRLNELGKTIPHAQVAQAIEAIQALWTYCFKSDA